MKASEKNGPKFADAESLIPAIAQDFSSGEVLMLAYMNREAWENTLATGEVVYYSRSRGRLWKKGEQSGNLQKVREVYVDCDGDTILLKVDQLGGAACHEGYVTCFSRKWTDGQWTMVGRRVFNPEDVYEK